MTNIDQYLKFMVKASASDLHLSSNCLPKFRIDGKMLSVSGDNAKPHTPEQLHTLLEEIIPERNQQEFTEKRDTDFAYAIDGLGRFRVNIFKDLEGIGAVFRFIPQNILTLEQLNMPPVIKSFCTLNKANFLLYMFKG